MTPDLDPPTVRHLRPHPAHVRHEKPHRDRLNAALQKASPPRRWCAQRLVCLVATDPDGRMTPLAELSRGRRWAAWFGLRAAEWLLRVPDGTVRAATAELRAERLR